MNKHFGFRNHCFCSEYGNLAVPVKNNNELEYTRTSIGL